MESGLSLKNDLSLSLSLIRSISLAHARVRTQVNAIKVGFSTIGSRS